MTIIIVGSRYSTSICFCVFSASKVCFVLVVFFFSVVGNDRPLFACGVQYCVKHGCSEEVHACMACIALLFFLDLLGQQNLEFLDNVPVRVLGSKPQDETKQSCHGQHDRRSIHPLPLPTLLSILVMCLASVGSYNPYAFRRLSRS